MNPKKNIIHPLDVFRGVFFFAALYCCSLLSGQGLTASLECHLDSESRTLFRFRTAAGWFSTDFSLQTADDAGTELRTWAVAVYPSPAVALFAGAHKRNGIAALAFNPVFSISSPFHRFTGTRSTALVEMATTLETERFAVLFRRNRFQFALSGPLDQTADPVKELWWCALSSSHTPSRLRAPSVSWSFFSGTGHIQESEQDSWFSTKTAEPEGTRWHTLLQSGFRWNAFDSTATLFFVHKNHQQPGIAVRAESSVLFPLFRISAGIFESSAQWNGVSQKNRTILSREYIVIGLGRQKSTRTHNTIIEAGLHLERTLNAATSLVSQPEQQWLIHPGIRLKSSIFQIQSFATHRIRDTGTITTVKNSGSVHIPVKTSFLSGRWDTSLIHESVYPDMFEHSASPESWFLKGKSEFRVFNHGNLGYSIERYKKKNYSEIHHNSLIEAALMYTTRSFLATSAFEWQIEHQSPHNMTYRLKTVIHYK